MPYIKAHNRSYEWFEDLISQLLALPPPFITFAKGQESHNVKNNVCAANTSKIADAAAAK